MFQEFKTYKNNLMFSAFLITTFIFPSIGNISTAEALGNYGCYDENRRTHITCLRQKLDSTPYGLTVPKDKRGLGKYGCGAKKRRKHVDCLRSLLDQHGPHLEDPNQFSDAEKQQWAANCHESNFKDCTLPAWVPPGYTLSINRYRNTGELIRCEPSLGCDPTRKEGCQTPSIMHSGDCITPGDGVIECRRKANSLTAFDPNEKRKMIAEAHRKCG
tara:strand:+ start:307 stop:954 length:648 start_codon:yes stop_codon:yes gene_type:complete